ncbi:NucA/NucB deoxyribonuclease domain-containing protein [Streptomyces orinoci]|uniref:NucA/NucB deoxyribonuclease domain-containing protein n=1 Tax=Streptomyces orinoci TaxID=67339 RepID=A0ABV3K670_STRON|nr:NucA/NucB deoxyribonuclease domain-containing protein [Streptomyces orinoci]
MNAKLRRVLAAGAATLGLLAGSVAGAQAAPATRTISVHPSGVRTVERPQATSQADCTVGNLVVTRYASCEGRSVTIVLLSNGRKVGGGTFNLWIIQRFDRKSLHWTEQVSITDPVLTPNARDLAVSVSASSPGNQVKIIYPQGHVLGTPSQGQLVGTFDLFRQAVRAEDTTYTFTVSKPGVIPFSFSATTVRYRCDNTFKGMRAGCVVPSVTTQVSMTSFRYISAGIRALRQRGGYWGDPSRGVPLTWLGAWIRQRHWDEVCKGRTPTAAERRAGRTSCDEYPFASTAQGGTTLPAGQREITFVPPRENNQQGGEIQRWLKAWRILSGDRFYVVA